MHPRIQEFLHYYGQICLEDETYIHTSKYYSYLGTYLGGACLSVFYFLGQKTTYHVFTLNIQVELKINIVSSLKRNLQILKIYNAKDNLRLDAKNTVKKITKVVKKLNICPLEVATIFWYSTGSLRWLCLSIVILPVRSQWSMRQGLPTEKYWLAGRATIWSTGHTHPTQPKLLSRRIQDR